MKDQLKLDTVNELNAIMGNDLKNAETLNLYKPQLKTAIRINADIEKLTEHIAIKHDLLMNKEWAREYVKKFEIE